MPGCGLAGLVPVGLALLFGPGIGEAEVDGVVQVEPLAVPRRDGLRRRRPTFSTAPPASCRIQDSAAVQVIIWAVETLTAGPSSTWHRPGSAAAPGSPGPGGTGAGVSAETPA